MEKMVLGVELALPGGQDGQGGLGCSQLEIGDVQKRVGRSEPPPCRVHPGFDTSLISLHHFLAQFLALFVPPGRRELLKDIIA